MDILNLVTLFALGVFAGVVGALVGGSGLLTIPALIFLGLSPQAAIGTTFLGSTGMNIMGWYKFHEKKMIDYKLGFILGVPALIGSILGATLVLQIDEKPLKNVIAVLTLLTLAFLFVNPNIGIKKTKHIIKNREYWIGGGLSFLIGIYTGFYGAVAGTFLSYVLILLFGQTFLESAATRKIAFTFSSVMSTIIFAMNHAVSYSMGIGLFISTSVGAYLGVHYSDRIGNVWVKRFFFITVVVMAVKLIW